MTHELQDFSTTDSSGYHGSDQGALQHDASHDLQPDLDRYQHHQHGGGFDAQDVSAFNAGHSMDFGALHSGFETSHGDVSEYSSASAYHFSHEDAVINAPAAGSKVSYSSCSGFSPYTTIDDRGHVYRHYGKRVDEYSDAGYIQNRCFYNKNGGYLGYASRDGRVYDDHNNLLGWQRCGTIYDKNGHEIPGAPQTSKGAIGAGAYLLFIQYGGV